MPRLSTTKFLDHYRTLRYLWLNAPGAFASLTHQEQRLLHDFFQPSEDLAEWQLIEHRRQVTLVHPSLPHSAGRVFKKLQPLHDNHTVGKSHRAARIPRQKVRSDNGTAIRVRAIVRPQPDARLMWRALLILAREGPRRNEL